MFIIYKINIYKYLCSEKLLIYKIEILQKGEFL